MAEQGEKQVDDATSDPQTSLGAIQVFERSIRAQGNLSDLLYHMVNDFPKFLQAEQSLAYSEKTSGKKIILAAGSIADVDRNSETLTKLEATLSAESHRSPAALRLGSIPNMAAMPFGLLLPFKTHFKGRAPDGLVIARSQPWARQLTEQAVYLSEVYAHAFERFSGQKIRKFKRFRRILMWSVAAAAVACLTLIPIPITVVAPARVISQVSIPAAPSLEGVVSDVLVAQSDSVTRGTPLYRLRDGLAQAELGEARARVRVAVAQETKLRAEALRIPTARQELQVAEAETKLAEISLARAEDLVARHTIRAPINGMVVADNLSSLPGTPLSFGDAPVRIINPDQLIVEADVALEDSVVVFDLQRAKVFFSDNPTNATPLTPQLLPFEPRPDTRGGVSYQMRFSTTQADTNLTLGSEGVVQLSGPDQPMGYVLFRRPIQWLYARVPW